MIKNLVIVPTYNERLNLQSLLPALMQVSPEVHVLVVDDNSPDGSADEVKQHPLFLERIFLLSRPKKEGLGRAYCAGFAWALERDYQVVCEMDADFSHRPQDLAKILEAMPSNDFVIGSRYVPGGAVVNWGLLRLLISRGGGIYSSLILGFPIRDWTGGFNCWNRKTLESFDLNRITSNGYTFQIELKYKACRRGFRFQEVPIVFEDRRVGKSKMNWRIVVEAIWKVWLLKWSSS